MYESNFNEKLLKEYIDTPYAIIDYHNIQGYLNMKLVVSHVTNNDYMYSTSRDIGGIDLFLHSGKSRGNPINTKKYNTLLIIHKKYK